MASELENVVLAYITERRRARRWWVFFKLLSYGFIATLAFFWTQEASNFNPKLPFKGQHVAVINIQGAIDSEEEASADKLIELLETAFQSEQAQGLILKINSPGGSPVQARRIYQAIQDWKVEREETDKKIYAVIEDMGTSAAYLVATAADEIYADATSLVGSIGVLMNGFGFVDTMNKLGAERRLYTAGRYKGLLDAFSPRNPEQDALIQARLNEVHAVFIEDVKRGRGKRLKSDPDLFSGLFWTGTEAVRLGLIDGLMDIRQLAEKKFESLELVDYTPKDHLLSQLGRKIRGMATLLQSALPLGSALPR